MEFQLRNIYFLVSLLTTCYYWIKIIVLSQFQNKNFLKGFYGFLFLNFLLVGELLKRWIEAGHFPLSNLYESLLFLSWAITLLCLIFEKMLDSEILGVIISPLVLCILCFTEFSLPVELQAAKPLVPALQSNWLFMHVSVMILSYASLLIGSVVALTYLVINNWEISIRFFNSDHQEILYFFDNLSYRSIGIGFCFLTLGILSGAVWANETWGTYWSWDPKETWALVTWLIFAIYLHTRLLYGWEGLQSARIASFGFILIWFCYLGVNLLGKGLHSYGFFT